MHAKLSTRSSWRAVNTWSVPPSHPRRALLFPHTNQVRNEIAVLKRISSGHINIVTLHDYFEVRAPLPVRGITWLNQPSRPPTISILYSIFAPEANSLTGYAPRGTTMRRTRSPCYFQRFLTLLLQRRSRPRSYYLQSRQILARRWHRSPRYNLSAHSNRTHKAKHSA